MKVTRGREAGKPSVQRTETVTGDMWGDPVLDGGEIKVNSVFFAPGGRTHWHRHAAGQLLLVTHGQGIVQTADGDTVRVGAGDVVFSPGGEKHWHGAAVDSFVQHTTITVGTTDWMEPVRDDQYDEANKR
jgi:quercetin dioxygenase-like cupin family protein